MARPKHLKGDKRDGYLSFRVSPALDEDVTVLAFLLGLSGTALCAQAIQEFANKHREAIDKVKAVWKEVRPNAPETQAEGAADE